MKKTVKNIRDMRRMVMTVANRLRKTMRDLSRALRKAWKLVKKGIIYTAAAGVTFRNTQEILAWLDHMDIRDIGLSLCREPGNEADSNAVKIYAHVRSLGKMAHIGYLKRDVAAAVAPLMDSGIEVFARLYGITGGYGGLNRGALVNVEL